MSPVDTPPPATGFFGRLAWMALHQRLVTMILLLLVVGAGLYVVPFDRRGTPLERFPADPIPVDAIPDIGEKQQIVFTSWPGRSPQDVEDQVTYPLVVRLLGVPGVKTVRATSMFGFSSIYVLFDDDADFYESRTRVLEKLQGVERDLPAGAQPTLGPDATGLGQVLWYTVEGEGFSLHELRTLQDFTIRYALLGVPGVAEVAGVGGYVREIQVDVDPEALRSYGVSLAEVEKAVAGSSLDTGAREIEVNGVEYFVRGVGQVDDPKDVARAVVRASDGTPLYVEQLATVRYGPAPRRGALDKAGAEVVGGVVTARYGANPQEVVAAVKEKLEEIAPALPKKALDDGTVSQARIVPFYDRSTIIEETVDTLGDALTQQMLITILVILLLLLEIRSAVLVAATLPLGVLLSFGMMKAAGIDSNVMSLGGIVIAIGTMVDMGIILTEAMSVELRKESGGGDRRPAIFRALSDVGSAVLAAVATTIISFLPVFAMSGPESRLFTPLAFTKTFALVASVIVSLLALPALASFFLRAPPSETDPRPSAFRARLARRAKPGLLIGLAFCTLIALTAAWMPLGPGVSFLGSALVPNLFFVLVLLGAWLGIIYVFLQLYPRMLRWVLRHKAAFLVLPVLLLAGGAWSFSTMKQEFMPPLDEGEFLYMPTIMPHAGIGEALDILQKQDAAFAAIPEVETAVGKIGRAETPLDPAPLSMIETIIKVKPEYGPPDPETGLRPRQWRDEIKTMDDIWNEIVHAGQIPGATSAPKLMPIATRLVMLQSGMRAPFGVKVKGRELEDLEQMALTIEEALREVPGVNPSTVLADRVVGKPYLEIEIDRERAARYGVRVTDAQRVIQTALGGNEVTTSIDGRERTPVRVRYQREERDSLEAMMRTLVPVAAPFRSMSDADGDGVTDELPGTVRPPAQVPLRQLARLDYRPGPLSIKSEDGFLVAYVTFDKAPGTGEVEAAEAVNARLDEMLQSGELSLPEGALKPVLAGTWENQVRSEQTLALLIPIALLLILVVLLLQLGRLSVTLIVFSAVAVAWAGGFVFLAAWSGMAGAEVSILGVDVIDVFRPTDVRLSVAVWIGFLALFGIATDDGVVMATFLEQARRRREPGTVEEVRAAVLEGGLRRIRPCLMTTATTVLALLPVLTSKGRGADVMTPLALPTFGGMLFELLTLFVVPTLYCAVEEARLRRRLARAPSSPEENPDD